MKINAIIFLFLLIGINLKAQSLSPTVANGHPISSDASTPKAFASAGCVELGSNMGFTNQSFLFEPYVGWFPIKGFELGLDPLLVSASFGDDRNRTSTSLLVLLAPSYNFSTGSIVYPFFEADLGVNSLISGEPALSTGGRVGVKLEIAKHILLNLSVQVLGGNFTGNNVPVGGGNDLLIGTGVTVHI